MKMFGEKFYKRLRKLMPWQRGLFALALAQRMQPNVHLFAEQTEQSQYLNVYEKYLAVFWQHLRAPSQPVDLKAALEKLESYLPELEDDVSFGASCTYNAFAVLCCAYHALVTRMGSEARQSSELSMQGVLDFIALQIDEALEEEDVYQHPLVESELEFQVELLKQVAHPRDDTLIASVKTLAHNEGISNLGLGGSA